MNSSRPEYWSKEPFPSPGDHPNPGIESRSPTLQADSLPAEPEGKPENTEVNSLSFLQQIFLTQESNRDLLHCRWILYQLNYQGSPATISSDGKESACSAGDPGLIPGLERSPGEGNGNLLQHSCLVNPRDGGAWWAAVYGVARSRTRLKRLSSSSSSRNPSGGLFATP